MLRGLVLQHPGHLGGPSVNSLQFINIILILGGPKMDVFLVLFKVC